MHFIHDHIHIISCGVDRNMQLFITQSLLILYLEYRLIAEVIVVK